MNNILKDRIGRLEEKIQGLIIYMEQKIDDRDWHGVADAAMDIRDLEAKKEVYKDEEHIFNNA